VQRIANEAGVTIQWIGATVYRSGDAGELLAATTAARSRRVRLRGVEGMLEAIRWAPQHKLPFFGICLGLQTPSSSLPARL